MPLTRPDIEVRVPPTLEVSMSAATAAAAPPVVTVGTHAVGAPAFLAAARFMGAFDPVLEHVVLRTAVLDKARHKGQSVSTEELQTECDAWRRAMRLHSAKDTTDWLSAIGYSLDDFEAEMEYRIHRRKRREAFGAAEVEAWFNDHRADFERAHLSHLVVKSEGLAKELLQQVKSEGKDFRQLALKHSTDPATKEAGGHLGWVRRSAFASEAAPKVFAARAGECVGPVKLAGGAWQLICVHEVLKPNLDEAAREEIKDALLREWLGKLRQETKVQLA